MIVFFIIMFLVWVGLLSAIAYLVCDIARGPRPIFFSTSPAEAQRMFYNIHIANLRERSTWKSPWAGLIKKRNENEIKEIELERE